VNSEKKLLYTLAAVQFTNIMDFMIMMPMGPLLMRTFNIAPNQFSYIVSSYTITAGISGFLSAFWVDRFDRKRIVQVCYAGFLLGTLFCGLSTDYYSMMAARILTGMFGGILASQVMAIVGDSIPMERRASAMGIVMTAFSAASVFGVPFGLKLSNWFDYHAPFLVIAGFGLLVQVALNNFVPAVNKHLINPAPRPHFYSVVVDNMTDKNRVFAMLMMFCLVFSQFSVISFISPYMVTNVGFREDQLFLIYLVGGTCTIFSMPYVGKMADKIGLQKVFTIGVISSMLPFLLITHMQPWPVYIGLIVAGFFFITMTARTIPASAIVSGAVHPSKRGSFMSFTSSLQQLGSGLGSLMAGAIIHKNELGLLVNYNYVGYISVIVSTLAIYIAWRIRVVAGN
jgi:predicted MFS family arabinose efflux permease